MLPSPWPVSNLIIVVLPEMKLFYFFILFIVLASCKKETFNTSPDAFISFSADTLKFDTVFTQTGSVTKVVKIKNENEDKILLTSIKLMGGTASPFHININGVSGSTLNNVELAGKDSLYIFVSVTINPTTINFPFIVRDSIAIAYNGNEKFIQLEAFGRNARFLNNYSVRTNENWTSTLPYVILGTVTVDSGAILTIEPGSKIYFHANAHMQVNGKLIANGSSDQRIVFTGDRLDEYYNKLPGSWPGITFSSISNNNLLQYVNIVNAFQGIHTTKYIPGTIKIKMQQCIIDNASDAGIISEYSSIQAENCLISNCGKNINLFYGGDYSFTHCTLAAYSTEFQLHKFETLSISDAKEENGIIITNPMQANFINCIFWGDNGIVDNEITSDKQGNNFNVSLDHCLYKASNDPANISFSSVIKNIDPLFDSIDAANHYFDFRTFNNLSAPGINQGSTTSLSIDLEGNNRNIGAPDLGSYEKQ